MSQIYKKILIVKWFGVKKIGENIIVKLNEAIKDLTPNPSPNGEGRDYRGYPYFAACFLMGVCCWSEPLCGQSLTLNIQHLTPTKANHQHLTLITQHPSEASPPAPLRMERGVITEIPLHVLQMFSIHSPSISRLIGVTSHTTPLSIRRGAGGEATLSSRPSHTL